jgi:manganese/zinc/iron transport system substrate-binding protein
MDYLKNYLNKRQFLGAMSAAFLLVIAGCNAPDKSENHAGHERGETTPHFTYKGSGPIKAVSTTGMIHDLVKNIGGTHVQSEALMGAGVDPHLYKATPGDIRKLSNADIVFYNGLHLEGKMADVFAKMSERKPSIAVAAGVPKEELLTSDSTTAYPDPHVWFDVQKWIKAGEAVRKSLKEFDPAHAGDYDKNAEAYLKQLREVDAYAKQQIAVIPKARRVLVTAHDAFRYFGKAYDMEVQGLQGISTASDVSVSDVQRIVNTLVSRKIKAVFLETSVSKRSIDAVVEGCRAKGHNVQIGGSLFSDAMGRAGTPEGTYAGMVRHNVDTMVKALK